jgi:nucleoside-diphosphate-sugar epimerase
MDAPRGMKILLIGSTGFIGKALGLYLENHHEVLKVSRSSDLTNIFGSKVNYDFVINCASSRLTADSFESYESNFNYPLKFLTEINAEHWIQIESYSQLQIPMGRQDPYVIDKQRFSDYLNLKTFKNPKAYHLYLPHVFGEGDRTERLISSAIFSIVNGTAFETSSGSQFLPLLYISDAVSGIAKFIENPTQEASCLPFWYGSVKDLLDLLSTRFDGFRPIFGFKSDPIDASFPRVQFPQCVAGWQPKMQTGEFLEWVKRKCVQK